MHFQTLLSPLPKVPRMVLSSSLLWWELGTSLPGHDPGEWLWIWHVTSKPFLFWHQADYYVRFSSSWRKLPLEGVILSRYSFLYFTLWKGPMISKIWDHLEKWWAILPLASFKFIPVTLGKNGQEKNILEKAKLNLTIFKITKKVDLDLIH